MTKHNHWGKKNPNYKHGMRGTRFYIVWKHINSRCHNSSSKDFAYYGGRGIKTLWGEFEKFKEEMFDSYCKHTALHGEKNTTIERIDNNGNYCVDNCKWATRKDQSRNTRRTNLITFNGETLCLVDWAKKIGVKRFYL